MSTQITNQITLAVFNSGDTSTAQLGGMLGELGRRNESLQLLYLISGPPDAAHDDAPLMKHLRRASGKYILLLDCGMSLNTSLSKLLSDLEVLDNSLPKWAIAFGQSDVIPSHSVPVVLRSSMGVPLPRYAADFPELVIQLRAVAGRLGHEVHPFRCEWTDASHHKSTEYPTQCGSSLEVGRVRSYQRRDCWPTTCTVLYWGPSVWRKVWSIARSISMLENRHYTESRKMLEQRAGRWRLLAGLLVPVFKRIDDLRWWRINWRTRCGF